MRAERLLGRLAGVDGEVVEGLVHDEKRGELRLFIRPRKNAVHRCGLCSRRGSRYDTSPGYRGWRALDFGTCKVVLLCRTVRVRCPEHGVVVARVSWARHRSRFTRDFEETIAWLATRMDKTSLSTMMRIAWRSVGSIIERVVAERGADDDGLDGLRRIGIDEISYKRRHKYLTVVVDHDSGRLIWAAEGRRKSTVHAFFNALGPERSRLIRLVSADAGNWIGPVVKQRCPQAALCLDPFHVVQWANRALDEVRRAQWRQLRKSGPKGVALDLQRSRFALWKEPGNLTTRQRAKLSAIAKLNRPLYRAYLLKEQLREVFKLKGSAGTKLLDGWLKWASRCRLKPFVELGRRIRRHRVDIDAALTHRLSNARVESMNTRIRLLTRMAFGFHSAQALIALARLKLGGLCRPLPGR